MNSDKTSSISDDGFHGSSNASLALSNGRQRKLETVNEVKGKNFVFHS